MNTPGKKYIVLSPETYEMLTRNQNFMSKSSSSDDTQITRNNSEKMQKLLQPQENIAMLEADQEMRNVWNRTDLSADEKVRYYTNEMNNFKTLRQSLTAPRPLEMKITPPLSSNGDTQQFRSAAIAAVASPARPGPFVAAAAAKKDFKN